MDAIVINSENSETPEPYRLLLNHSGRINFKRSNKYVALSNLSMYYTWKNMKKTYKNSKFKISGKIWNEKFELLDLQMRMEKICPI